MESVLLIFLPFCVFVFSVLLYFLYLFFASFFFVFIGLFVFVIAVLFVFVLCSVHSCRESLDGPFLISLSVFSVLCFVFSSLLS